VPRLAEPAAGATSSAVAFLRAFPVPVERIPLLGRPSTPPRTAYNSITIG